LLCFGCGGGSEQADPTNDTATSIKEIEKRLALSGHVYLIFDFNQMEVSIKLFGAAVRDCKFECDSAALDEWKSSLVSKPIIEDSVISFHLSSAKAMVGERELAIVAEVSQVSREEIQRFMPEEMVLYFGQGRRILIKTDAEGTPVSRLANLGNWFRESADAVLGRADIELRMSGPDAMALYGVVREVPKIIIKP